MFALKAVVAILCNPAGILRDKTMHDKLMYIPNYDKQNYHFCRIKLMLISFETVYDLFKQSQKY